MKKVRFDEQRTLDGLTYLAGVEYEVDEVVAGRLLERFPVVCHEVGGGKSPSTPDAIEDVQVHVAETPFTHSEGLTISARAGGVVVSSDFDAATIAAQSVGAIEAWLFTGPAVEEVEAVLEAERAGKNRKTAVSALEDFLA